MKEISRSDFSHQEPWRIAAAYHERTKHHYHRHARGPGYLDWDSQPDPFRRYDGAPTVRLPFPERDETPLYDALYEADSRPPKPLTAHSISNFLFYSMALSAWKRYGDSQWALRVNPSSGNLHPTEAYAIVGPAEGLEERPALYHYDPKEHGLEVRCEFNADSFAALLGDAKESAFLLALASIHWREAWKYGERAFRYCRHDVGHAIAALRFAARLNGWTLRTANPLSDDALTRVLGLDRPGEFHEGEWETADALLFVDANGADLSAMEFKPGDENARRAAAEGRWRGQANRLSRGHHDWPVIEEVSKACIFEIGGNASGEARENNADPADTPPMGFDFPASQCLRTSGDVIRARRSAVAMDGESSLPRERFFAMLARALPSAGAAPWDALPFPPLVHLGLFAHRIEGLDPGLYVFVRNPDHQTELRAEMRGDFLWSPAPAAPAGFPLYFLHGGDVRGLAASVSCGQDIAADGAFSLGMLARFEPVLRECGAHFYRRMHWEAGAIGQVLYLEAEAAGFRGTGIGCFFDDAVHDAFGFKTRRYQSLYHFTIGGPVDDARLTSNPGYEGTPL